MIFYLVIDTNISERDFKRIRNEAKAEFARTRPENELSVAMNPLYNEAYMKIVAHKDSPYMKKNVKAATNRRWIKSVHRTNESFKLKLQEYWATLEDETA